MFSFKFLPLKVPIAVTGISLKYPIPPIIALSSPKLLSP